MVVHPGDTPGFTGSIDLAFHSCAYLFASRHHVFYFRQVIPSALRSLLGKREIRLSLHTSSRSLAVGEARRLKVRFDAWFATMATMKLPPPQLVRIENDTALYAVRVEVPSPPGTGTRWRMVYVRIPAHRDIGAFDVGLNADGSLRITEMEAQRDISPFGVKLNADGSLSITEIPNDASPEQIQNIGQAAKALAHDLRAAMPAPVPTAAVTAVSPSLPAPVLPGHGAAQPADTDFRMSTVLQVYHKEKLRVGKRGTWTLKTAQQNLSSLRIVQCYLDDPDLRSVRPLHITKMKGDFHYLPKRLPTKELTHDALKATLERQKAREKNGLPLLPVIDVETLNHHLTRLSSFMLWCHDNGYTDSNPAYKKTIKVSKASDDDDEARVAWSDAELRTIFESDFYRDNMYVHAYQYWLPVLGLFTGARINELAQLHTTDVIQDGESGIWCLRISSDSKKGQRVKNGPSKRLTPLHDKVLELGFLEFVAARRHLRPKDSVALFSGLTLQRDGYGKNASRWFNEVLKSYLGYQANDGRVFHSLRKNVIDQLKQHLLSPELRDGIRNKDLVTKAIVGHKGEHDITWDSYAGDFRPAVLQPFLNRLQWPVQFAPYAPPDPTEARARLKAWRATAKKAKRKGVSTPSPRLPLGRHAETVDGQVALATPASATE